MKITNKNIHEARGLCWHEFQSRSSHCICIKCELKIPYHTVIPPKPDYLTCLADAWVLFLELPVQRRNLISTGHVKDLFFCGEIDWDRQVLGAGWFGKTPMEVISKEYYRWRKE